MKAFDFKEEDNNGPQQTLSNPTLDKIESQKFVKIDQFEKEEEKHVESEDDRKIDRKMILTITDSVYLDMLKEEQPQMDDR